MSDIKQTENSIQYLFRDMGDGTYARVVAISGTLATTDTQGGTRRYNLTNNIRQAFNNISTASVLLPTLVGNREMMVHASERCFIRFGDYSVAAAGNGNGQLILEPGERFHLKVPEDVTHFRVIRDTTDGFVTLTSVVA